MAGGLAAIVRPKADPALNLHANCVALNGAGLLILGASGRGKSSLALQLMALGAGLVADDRTDLWPVSTSNGPALVADAPDVLRGRIEARGLGLLRATAIGPCIVTLVVDLDTAETERLPPYRKMDLLDVELPVLHMVDSPAFPAAILQYLRWGRHA
jgi:HPr kinase/phosphorylase